VTGPVTGPVTGNALPCEHPGCGLPGHPYIEPAGTWCRLHVPVLWQQPENPWLSLRCHRCGKPGAWPKGSYKAVCRAHAPARIARYLAKDSA
jgi:hypothetical protein